MASAAIIVPSACMFWRAGYLHGWSANPPVIFEFPRFEDGLLTTLIGTLMGGIFAVGCLLGFGISPSIPRKPNTLAILIGSLGGLTLYLIHVSTLGQQQCGFSPWLWYAIPLGLVAPTLAAFAGRTVELAFPSQPGLCKSCGHQLAGAATCPECGTNATED
jgi:hypothetical protein